MVRPRPAVREKLGRAPTVSQLTLVLVLAGLAWRALRYALGFPIWGDEAFVAVNFVVRDFRGLIQPLVYGQIAPLGFMWAELAVSRVLGFSEWALRLLPFVAGLVALLLFWRLAAQVLPRRAALLAVGLLAASFYAVRHAAEVKPYSTDLLISLGLTLLSWAVWRAPHSAGRWAALILLAGASAWCSYPAMFVGGSVGLLLTGLVLRTAARQPDSTAGGGACRHRRAGLLSARTALIGWLAYAVIFCGSSLAMYLLYARPHAEYAARVKEIPMWTLAFPPLGEPGKLLKWLLAIHTGEMFAYPHGAKPPGSIVTFALAVIGSVRLWQTRRPFFLLLVGPLPLTFIAAALHAYPYGGSARTSLYLAPAICLLAGLGLYATLRCFLRGRRLRVGLLISAAALAAFALGEMVYDVLRPYQSVASRDSRAAVLTVARQTSPGDAWVIFNADREVPYAPYLGHWRGVGGQFVFDVLRFAPVSIAWAPPPETVAPTRGSRIWLLVYRAQGKKVLFPEEQLTAYVTAMGQRLSLLQHDSYLVKHEKEKFESVEVYQFGG